MKPLIRWGFILDRIELKTEEVFDFRINTPIKIARKTTTTPMI
jgi:hypothetical protein